MPKYEAQITTKVEFTVKAEVEARNEAAAHEKLGKALESFDPIAHSRPDAPARYGDNVEVFDVEQSDCNSEVEHLDAIE